MFRYNCQPIVEAGQALLCRMTVINSTIRFGSCRPPAIRPAIAASISAGLDSAVVIGDLMHHALQCREPDWSTIFDWDPAQAARSRRKFLSEIAGTGHYVLPIDFPHPTTGLIEADGARFRYKFVR